MKKTIGTIILATYSLFATAQSPMIGEVRVFAGNYEVYGFAFCSGQTINIASNTALFSLLGTTYGGNGTTTFALPNLQTRAVIGKGQAPGLSNYVQGQTGGNATVSLTTANLPLHGHTFTIPGSQVAANADTPAGTVPAVAATNAYSTATDAAMAANSLTTTLQPAGATNVTPQNNMQPYLGLNFIIGMQGLYQGAEEPYLGEIRMIAGTRLPDYDWLPCDGRLLSIAEYDALYALLGTTYGGDGVNTFALPDLRGRIPVGVGQGPGLSNYALGQTTGTETVTLTTNHMMAHTHVATATEQVYSGIGDASTPVGNYPAVNPQRGNEFSTTGTATSNTFVTDVSGGNTPIDNIQPYATLQYIICTMGIFPTQN